MYLVDAHEMGARKTGNETWIRNVWPLLLRLAQTELLFTVIGPGEAQLQAAGAVTARVRESGAHRLFVDLPRTIRATRPDAIFYQYTPPAFPIPSVALIHDVASFEAGSHSWISARTRLQYRLSAMAAVRHAALILVPSNFTRGRLISLLRVRASKVRVAGNAVDSQLVTLLNSRSRRRPYGRQRILCVGNVLPRKNLLLLGSAVQQMEKSGCDVEMRVVGQVPAGAARLRNELALTLGDRFSHTGYVPQSTLAQEYLDADVMAMPSKYEGFGIPLLEAMAAKLPVVCSDSSALPEVVGDAGLTVPANDLSAWTGALQTALYNESARLALIQRGEERSASFSWERSASVLLDALAHVAGHSS